MNGELQLTVNAECWHGNASEKPEDDSKIMKLNAGYEGGDLVVAGGPLPKRTVENPNSYSCIYGIEQIVYPADACNSDESPNCLSSYIPHENTTLYYEGSEGTYTHSTGGGEVTYGYITEGTDSTGYVSTSEAVIDSPGQTWLEDEDNTDANVAGGNDPFQHFFEGDPYVNPPERPRHPVEEYCVYLYPDAPGCN